MPDSFTIRLASGNSGVTAAVNETIEFYEGPSTLIVYAMVLFLTYITYFDWRAAVGCMLPLLFSTFFGYFFMLQLDIGLKVSTLPVIVLVVGVGVDYAYYIYNRLQYHLSRGDTVTDVLPGDDLGDRQRRVLHRVELRARRLDLVVLAAEVPGRHGHAADVHVPDEHDHGA